MTINFNPVRHLIILAVCLLLSACINSEEGNKATEKSDVKVAIKEAVPTPLPCDYNGANNKMLALGKVQGRLVAIGGDAGTRLANRISADSAAMGQLIGDEKYQEACELADKVAKEHELDLDNELKDMITMEDLERNGGKGSGTCSVADAAKMQMALHADLQADVNAGKHSPNIFRKFNEDTKGYALMLSTDPSKACELFTDLRAKYAKLAK
ncbi:MAG TPA: hypothetical protein PKA63_13110 [Oligoflexia bacterium]|nr:hypothetical protein [Oligoflexia bacterium]HMP49599.1 hypothetical protein [Oligoflexia bacterium]